MTVDRSSVIKRVVIVGGGTAGWLAANHLGASLRDSNIQILLVESPDIPTVGVGEGTVPQLKNSLKKFGLKESDIFKHCDATFKQSIKFVDWVNPQKFGEGEFYHHLFDYPFPSSLDLTPYWYLGLGQKDYADSVTVQQAVCEAGLAPKLKDSVDYEGVTSYAYHFDAAKFALLLSQNAVERFNVEHIKASVTEVNVNAEGLVESVETDRLGLICGDFFIDCTGFSSLLLGQKLDVPFIDKSHSLFADTAIVKQVSYEDDHAIPSHTIASAKEAGWIWDIGLQSRRGIGYVYSSRYCEDSDANRVLARYLNQNEEEAEFRKISFKVGCREVFWKNNCVAIGLSQGFAEPLEATALLITDFACMMLAEEFPRSIGESVGRSKGYNRILRYSWERIFDFIKLHYFLSQRSDTEFWVDNQKESLLSESLLDKLEVWKHSFPSEYDFFSSYELFNLENYLYILNGMRFPFVSSNKLCEKSFVDMATSEFGRIESVKVELKKRLQENRAYIKSNY